MLMILPLIIYSYKSIENIGTQDFDNYKLYNKEIKKKNTIEIEKDPNKSIEEIAPKGFDNYKLYFE